ALVAKLVPHRVLAADDLAAAVGRRARTRARAADQTEELRRAGVGRVRVVRLDVVVAGARIGEVGVGVANRRAQGGGDARYVVRLGLALDGAQAVGVALPIVVRVVVGAHDLREAVGALEAVLAGEVAGPPVHLGDVGEELALLVDLLPGAGIVAARQRV